MQRKIIGLVGRSRVGKDTVARLIKQLLPETDFEIHHIAKPLKDSIASMYRLSSEQLHGNLKDVVDMRYGHSPRELCTIWNYKLTHLHGPRFLVHRLFESLDENHKNNIIIPDVRFCHDCYEVRRRNGILVKVVRTRSPVLLSEEDHIDQLSADVTIENDSTLEILKNKVNECIIPLVKS